MTITKEQGTTVEMTLMDYLLDMEDFIQGKKTLIMTEFKEGNLLKENANYESTPNQKD